jgi:hypothetical protein
MCDFIEIKIDTLKKMEIAMIPVVTGTYALAVQKALILKGRESLM